MQDDQTKKFSMNLTRESDVPTLDQLIEEIYAWQQATFIDATSEGRIAHFKEEIAEYLENPNSGEEAADVFMLFVAVFKYHDVDLRAEVERKLEINKERTWAKVPGGYSKHVKGEPDISPDIDWDGIPPEHKYAWLVIDPTAKAFTWCTSETKPKATLQGYNGSCIRIWNGNKGVEVRRGVDFRMIFRQRPAQQDKEEK